MFKARMLCIFITSFIPTLTWSLTQTPEATSQLDKNNLTGSWQCHVNMPELEIQQTVTFSKDQTYQDTGTIKLNTPEKEYIFDYEGQGKWSLQPSRIINFKNYNITKLTSITPQDAMFTFFKNAIKEDRNSWGKILRLSSKNLYYKAFDETPIDIPIVKCKKIKPE